MINLTVHNDEKLDDLLVIANHQFSKSKLANIDNFPPLIPEGKIKHTRIPIRVSMLSASIILAIIAHLGIMVWMQYTWHVPKLAANVPTKKTIKSYLIYSPKTIAQPVVIDKQPKKAQHTRQVITQDQSEQKAPVLSKIDPQKDKTTTSTISRNQPATQSNINETRKAEVEQRSINWRQASKNYVKKKQIQHVVDSGSPSGGYSASIMHPEPNRLFVPQSHQVKLIPTEYYENNQKILKHGDTCFRVTNANDPIDPYKEVTSLGYDCGDDPSKQLLYDSIAKYIHSD